jgi:protein dithiol oxidoreductase (disulfide-forming)
MFTRLIKAVCLVVTLMTANTAMAATAWKAGQHYYVIQPAQPTTLNSKKVEVTEVFSYGCPACNSFYATAERIKASLPANAQMTFVPASFNAAEAWPMFQRAYLTAQALGVADKTHKPMFDAIWKTEELTYLDPKTQRIKKVLPSIEDAAKFYSKAANIPQDKFLSMSKSFSVEAAVKRADQLVKAYRIESTPTIVINGKYRMTAQSAGGIEELIELVKYLVAQESKP